MGITPKEKKELVTTLCNRVRDEVLSKIDSMPDRWDGHELRELLAIKFDNERVSSMKSSKRKREFDNYIAVFGLR